MIVTPKDAPAPVPGHISEHQKAANKRESAIKAFIGDKGQSKGQAQETPVANPSNVSPEELGALQPSKTDNEFTSALEAAKAKENGQEPNSETPEATPEAPKAATKTEESPLSSQYAKLARQEKALRAKALELRAKEEALKAKEPVEAPKPTFDPSKHISVEDFKKNPWKYVQDSGVTYDQLTQEALNAPTPEQMQQQQVISRLEAKIAELEGKVTGTDKRFEEQQQSQYKQAVTQIRNEVKTLVASDENFEMVKATNSVQDVVDLIEKTFQEDGILMTVEEAAKQVEEYLADEAYKLAQSKKIQNRLKPKAPEPAATPKQDASKQQQPIKTLSNAISSSRQLSARERALAAAAHGPAWREKI